MSSEPSLLPRKWFAAATALSLLLAGLAAFLLFAPHPREVGIGPALPTTLGLRQRGEDGLLVPWGTTISGAGVRIEVEADHLEQVRAFLEIDEVDVILLDNMKRTEMREAVALRKNKVKFEASGDITLKNIRQIAATGVDYISVGALTHSAPAINLSLEIRNVTP